MSAQPDVTNHAGQTALMMAAMFGHHEIVVRLLAAGARADIADVAGNTALSVAAGRE